jgi:hypothetical protein
LHDRSCVHSQKRVLLIRLGDATIICDRQNPAQKELRKGVHAPFARRGTAVPCRGTAPLCPSSRRLSPVPAGEVRRVPPSAKPFFQPFPCPVEIRPISQGRPCSTSGQTRSVERKQGKGVVRGFPGGAPPPSLPRGARERSLQASPLARKLLHDKSCVHPRKAF